MMIFANGSVLTNSYTGRAVKWIDKFSSWNNRALFTLESKEHRQYLKKALADADFIVMPANNEGIAAYIENINQKTGATEIHNDNLKNYPEILYNEPFRWLNRHEPDLQDVHKLLHELQYYLGEKGFYWLSACAVYPELNWNLTLYLGHQLKLNKSIVFNEQSLSSLVCLPWFRHGTMPDWLRKRLIYDLSTKQEKNIRKAIYDLFITAIEKPSYPRMETPTTKCGKHFNTDKSNFCSS